MKAGPGGAPRPAAPPGPPHAGAAAALAWWLAALLGLLAILPLNGAPLAYFDTGGYLAQGTAMLKTLGLDLLGGPPGDGLPAPATPEAGTPGTPGDDDAVVGSRSATYALFLTLLRFGPGIGVAPVLQALAFLVAIWLPVRALARIAAPRLPVPAVTALAALAACLGAAPFYAGYLMPDIFAPVLILAGTTLALLAGAMRPPEIAAAFLLGAFAATAHPSHLAIAGLMVPAAALVLVVLRPRRGRAGLVLVALIPLLALAERQAFRVAVETVRKAEVTYLPFVTARLIVDGPGLAHLAATCPRAGFATCDLYARLAGDPRRVTPTNILYERDPALGSFVLLPAATQRAIAREQQAFALEVVAARPVAVVVAVLRNTAVQLVRVSVHQTLPTGRVLPSLEKLGRIVPASLLEARLTVFPAWLPPLQAAHAGLYLVSALALLLLLFRPGLPPAVRALALLALMGILANAFVCGAVSQPADRYGARVALLLPALAVLLALFLPARRSLPAT